VRSKQLITRAVVHVFIKVIIISPIISPIIAKFDVLMNLEARRFCENKTEIYLA
jgi:hypothetical protein